VAGGCLVARRLAAGPLPLATAADGLDNPLVALPWPRSLLAALAVAWRYLWLCLWPQALSADYSYDAIPVARAPLDPETLAGLTAWAALLALGVLAYRRRHARVSFSVGLTVLPFLPVSNLVVHIGTIMAERLFYLPSAGLCLLLGLAWDRLRSRHAQPATVPWLAYAKAVTLAIALALLTGRTLVRNEDWKSSLTLFQSAARVVPGSAKVHANLAKIDQDPQVVIEQAELALATYPDYAKSDWALLAVYGSALLRAGRPDEALSPLQRAAVLGARYAPAHHDLGRVLLHAGRWREAEIAFHHAILIRPRFAPAFSGLSAALRAQGRNEEALQAAAQAIRLDPDLAEAHHNLGRAAEALGRTAVAQAAYAEARRLEAAPLSAAEGAGSSSGRDRP